MSVRLLLVDIGNTSATLGIWDGTAVTAVQRFPRRAGTAVNVAVALETFRVPAPQAVAIASVVPDLTGPWREGLSSGLGVAVWELVPGNPLPIAVSYPEPASIGADRLANAVAAVQQVGAPVVVADFGTALTFDIVTADRGYVGGVIAPGIGMMYEYFAEKTALLPQVDPEPCTQIIGQSTAQAMHAGATYGYRGMVREIFHEIRRELGLDRLSLLATGGFASQVLQDFKESVIVSPTLTLEGLALAWEYANLSEQ
jgi:type III pantothenate kinase